MPGPALQTGSDPNDQLHVKSVANTPEAPRQLISNRQTRSATAPYRKQPPDRCTSSDKSTKKKNGKEIKVVAEGQDEEKEESMRDRVGTRAKTKENAIKHKSSL